MLKLFRQHTRCNQLIRSLKTGHLKYSSPTSSKDVRVNQFNIQLLPQYIRDHIFGPQPGNQEDINSELVDKAKEHLTSHEIDFTKGSIIKDVPKPSLVELRSDNIKEHFDSIAYTMLQPYLYLVDKLCNCQIPEPPAEWKLTPGWIKYGSNEPVKIMYPDESALVIDVETCMAVGPDPVLATAVSPTCWYSWVSPRLVQKLDEEWHKEDLFRNRIHQIPIRDDADTSTHRIIVGHNVSFDRCRLREEYNLAKSNTHFLDTMALHMCVNGVTTSQRGKWLKAEGEGEDQDSMSGWMGSASPGALRNLYKLYLGKILDKAPRDLFLTGTLEQIRNDFQNGITYCAKDAIATLEIFQRLLPLFKQSSPSPVTILGMMEMGSAYMPTNNKDWSSFVTNCDEYHANSVRSTSVKLRDLANKACDLSEDNLYLLDPWLSGFDWNFIESKKKTSKILKWYNKELGVKSEEISPQKRIVPLLLRLVWEENPLHFVEHLGWGYIVPAPADDKGSLIYSLWIDYLNKYLEFLQANQHNKPTLLQEVRGLLNRFNEANIPCTDSFSVNDKIISLKEDYPTIKTAQILKKIMVHSYKTKFGTSFGRVKLPGFDIPFDFYRIPHKNGDNYNCGKPLGRDYEFAMQNNIMKSRVSKSGADILKAEKFISFWRSNHRRIKNQMIVNVGTVGEEAVILPNLCVAGTVTRRAVQNTWLTASNAEEDRVGSELKSLITAPPGYVLVGADVDAQELWIASLLSDSHFAKIHGCTGIGWMTLQGDKSSGTDLHSRTANSLGITRNQAKVINYARIYSSGLSLTVQLLSTFLPNESIAEVTKKAKLIYKQTKGIHVPVGSNDDMYSYRRTGRDSSNTSLEWSGGTESYLFNKLEEIANSKEPRTPALNCRISSALLPDNVKSSFYTSRLNWVVQSSGVDYLHLLLVSMKWIMDSYDISGRYCLSIHDDIRFLVREEDAERAVLALQLSNLYTRCLFSYMTSVPDLPLSVAFFSAVEIDRVLRKDPTNECITPSNPDGLHKARGIPKGKSFDIHSILKLVSRLEKVS
ncbi:DNA polymerase subunit gamma-1 isoform X1 [Oopsacas minuta]|uniref:Mitochondrial DNA polymerase catalytic subunit n=1 Tax=Oopsacas minuta TaxID=111878 RepID=A0AAV7KGK1_9METZ|nr:DNA polymerase subunit gamma-1 isoform X1 [Oopsacas minuta]